MAFNRVINKDTIITVLSAIVENNKLAVDDFDSILLSYSNIPVILIVNENKIDRQNIDTVLERSYEVIDKDSEIPKELKEILIRKISEDKLRSPDDKLELGIGQLDEYSYFIEMNHHLHTDLITSSQVFWFFGFTLAGFFLWMGSKL